MWSSPPGSREIEHIGSAHDEHPDTLNTRHELARWTGAAGDAAPARDQYAELLQVRSRVLGPEHPDTLVTRYQLARWTREAMPT